MHITTRKVTSPVRALLATLAVALLALAACPAPALAAEAADVNADGAATAAAATADESADAVALTDEAANAVAYADNDGRRTYYTGIDEAITAAEYGATIVMSQDWILNDECIELSDNSVVTIDMNGHKIQVTKTKKKKGTIELGKNAQLTLTSSRYASLSYRGWDNGSSSWIDCSENLGGLVTGADTQTSAIYMNSGSTLTLDGGVAVAGNKHQVEDTLLAAAGGVYATGGCTINLKNGASIKRNWGEVGGIYVRGENVTINIDNASIDGNCGVGEKCDGKTKPGHGGGIYSASDATRITMKNGGKIVNNRANMGGGVYFNKSYFAIESDDGTGEIGSNEAVSSSNSESNGGGICVASETYSTHCSIRGVSIHDNSASDNGGGVYLNQDRTHLIDCKITGNTAGKDGGGVFVYNSDCSIQSCTITGNSCNGTSENYEGGGVFVGYRYDLELTGKCTIAGNKRVYSNGASTADDLFLSTISGESGYAYITGGVDAGSKVGIRTGIVGKDRMIGKNISTYTAGTYFIDLDNYFVTHGSDHNGDLWQRYGAWTGFAVKVNGADQSRAKWNETATADGTSTTAGKHFWYWDTASCTGFSPVSDYINDTNKYDEKLTFTMPQNEVDLTAVYADCATRLLVGLDKPVAGEELPAYATLRRTDGGNGGQTPLNQVAITWYKVGGDGTRSVATGTAEYGATYVAQIGVEAQPGIGLFFSESLTEKDVTVRTSGDGTGDGAALSATVDAAGKLTAELGSFEVAARPHYTITVSRPVIGQSPSSTATVTWDGGQRTSEVTIWWLDKWGNMARSASAGQQYRFVIICYGDDLGLPEGLTADDFEVRYADTPDAGPFPLQDAHVTVDDEFNVTYLNATSDWIDAILSTPQHGSDGSEGETGTAGDKGGGSGASGDSGVGTSSKSGTATKSGAPNTGDASGNPAPLAVAGAALALAAGVALRRREQ